MVEYKHYENEKIRLTVSDGDTEKLKKDAENGVKIVTDFGEFVFFPSKVVVDPVGDPILYIKFNHKERLVLFHYTRHPESRMAAENFKLAIMMAYKMTGVNYAVRDIMEYITEIEKVTKKLEDGEIPLKEGVHPDMKDAIDHIDQIDKKE